MCGVCVCVCVCVCAHAWCVCVCARVVCVCVCARVVCVCGACGVCVKGKGKENMHIHVCLVRGYTVHCMYVGGKGGAQDSVCIHSWGEERWGARYTSVCTLHTCTCAHVQKSSISNFFTTQVPVPYLPFISQELCADFSRYPLVIKRTTG